MSNTSKRYATELLSLIEKYKQRIHTLEDETFELKRLVEKLEQNYSSEFGQEASVHLVSKGNLKYLLREEFFRNTHKVSIGIILSKSSESLTPSEIAYRMFDLESSPANQRIKAVNLVSTVLYKGCIEGLWNREASGAYSTPLTIDVSRNVDAPVLSSTTVEPVMEQTVKAESIASVPSVSIANVKAEPKTQPAKQSQTDIFADMGDFSRRQIEKHYPKKAAVMS